MKVKLSFLLFATTPDTIATPGEQVVMEVKKKKKKGKKITKGKKKKKGFFSKVFGSK